MAGTRGDWKTPDNGRGRSVTRLLEFRVRERRLQLSVTHMPHKWPVHFPRVVPPSPHSVLEHVVTPEETPEASALTVQSPSTPPRPTAAHYPISISVDLPVSTVAQEQRHMWPWVPGSFSQHVSKCWSPSEPVVPVCIPFHGRTTLPMGLGLRAHSCSGLRVGTFSLLSGASAGRAAAGR